MKYQNIGDNNNILLTKKKLYQHPITNFDLYKNIGERANLICQFSKLQKVVAHSMLTSDIYHLGFPNCRKKFKIKQKQGVPKKKRPNQKTQKKWRYTPSDFQFFFFDVG